MRGARSGSAWIRSVSSRLVRSPELERQRMERERAEKARVAERGTMLDANAAVWMPAHIDGAELVHGANAEAVRKAGAEPSGVA